MNARIERSLTSAMAFAAVLIIGFAGRADEPAKTTLKTEHFDSDPGWEGFNNHIVSDKRHTVVQDFGYSATSFAARDQGEIGGRVTRAYRPAYYAAKIRKTLNDKLTASGTFAVTGRAPGSTGSVCSPRRSAANWFASISTT